MRIRLVTQVSVPLDIAVKGFNQDLFGFLMPSRALATLVKYEGQSPGDIVDIAFRIPFLSNWTVIIKDSWHLHREYGFVDRGLRAPMGIVYWEHIHRLVARDTQSCFIIDEMDYETRWNFLDFLLYLPLFSAFYFRTFKYEKYYRKLNKKLLKHQKDLNNPE